MLLNKITELVSHGIKNLQEQPETLAGVYDFSSAFIAAYSLSYVFTKLLFLFWNAM